MIKYLVRLYCIFGTTEQNDKEARLYPWDTGQNDKKPAVSLGHWNRMKNNLGLSPGDLERMTKRIGCISGGMG
jgi:hypothetical protein